jgi:hypothetical protein
VRRGLYVIGKRSNKITATIVPELQKEVPITRADSRVAIHMVNERGKGRGLLDEATITQSGRGL